MRNSWAIVAILSLVACSAEPGASSEHVSASDAPLVNGHVATESEYPSTVALIHDNVFCTAVKVGERHFLTAAHCMSNPQSITQISVTPDNNLLNFVNLSVVSVNNHPQWENCTSCAGDGSMSDFGLRPDVSLIIVNETTPQIAAAVIDSTAVAVGSSVTLTGYGCEHVEPAPPNRFKVGDSSTISPLDLDPAPTIPLGYSTTYGPAVVSGSPALCPGDSGGPLFRTGTNKVIGINALVSGTDAGEVGNWFTRLDTQSRYNVFSWLSSLMQPSGNTPCASICSNPTAIASQNYSSGPLGTSERCYESTANFVSGNCGGFASGRTLSINGTTMACTGQNWTLPAKRNGGYCIKASAGNNSWAWFTTW
ncbi:MAG: trypsin-like serine protease [Myxococcota bacterium]